MANTNTDLTEEDAADLQFPKESSPSKSSNSLLKPRTHFKFNDIDQCTNCTNELSTPYIYCVVCELNICLQCFSNGCEFLNHHNDHNYQIIRDDFILYQNSDWTAKEEITLLDSLLRYKNWNLVAKELPNRNIREIKKHYDHYYLDRHGSNELPHIKENPTAVFPEPIVPYRFRITNTDEPPRYAPNTIGYQYLAGYNPARSDFENEYDTNAEDMLSNLKLFDIDDPYVNVMNELQCGVIRAYNRRLQERQRWKQIIRDHGLLVSRKIYAWLHRYDLTVTKPVYEKLIRFMQFCTPFQFEFLMEGLHRSGELKIQILRLCELRRKGIRSLADARLYLKLKPLYDKCENDLKEFQMQTKFNWRIDNKTDIPSILQQQQQLQQLQQQQQQKKRSSFTPLEIIGMPGYEKLTIAERDLCKNVRLVPITYLELKELLINENKKMGSVKLKTARKMLKIDVNKTRRLFDFLVQEGYISKAAS